MCDFIQGELIVCHDGEDEAGNSLMRSIQEGEHPNSRNLQVLRLEDKLAKSHSKPRSAIRSRFYHLRVPEGDEAHYSNVLHSSYKNRSLTLAAQSNFDPSKYDLSVTNNGLLMGSFAFERPRYDDYKKVFGWTGPSGTKHKILIVDSGALDVTKSNFKDCRNFVDPSTDATDDHPLEHGTAVAEIIEDLCPSAQLLIYKVLDSNNRASEWDTLAAIAADSGANIINLSLGFGLGDVTCATCGRRESHSSRSAVFENLLNQVIDSGVIVVAAAGNGGASELKFPARFGKVLAIESINQNCYLSEFSNRGDQDQNGGVHERVFVLPGGEKTQGSKGPTEWIGTDTNGHEIFGTSFSTAYASAIVAHVWDQHSNLTADEIVKLLASNTDQAIKPSYDKTIHGNGVMVPC
jgi:subtilisin family serine protease